MESLFLEILAEEAQKGNKPSNTFRAVSIKRVATTISERFQVQCDAKHVENHLRTVKNTWKTTCTIREESGLGWDDNMKMITCDRVTYDAAVTIHPKYAPFLNKKIEFYDEMALVVGQDMATGSFAKTFADIDLDNAAECLLPLNFDNEDVAEERTKVSSSGTSKRKRKNLQESVDDDHIQFVGEKLGEIAEALKKFTEDKTPHLYEEVMSMKKEGFDDDFLCYQFTTTQSSSVKSHSYGLNSLSSPTSVAVSGILPNFTPLVTLNPLTVIPIIGLSIPPVSTSTSPFSLKGGCFIVDSTRRGKRFPDSMSKTIPIWTCVLNRAIFNYLNKLSNDESSLVERQDSGTGHNCVDWDCSLHLPLWVSETEKAAIEDRLEGWTKDLEASGADIATLASCLKKPLRPLWISQRTVIWINEVPDYDSWDFTPIILVSASSSSGVTQHRTTSEFSWNYIPGAGDDEESWARGLSPNLFWSHAYDLISAGPDSCNQKVADIVEKDRVYRAQRGQNAPQITAKPSISGSSPNPPCLEPLLCSDLSSLTVNSSEEDCGIFWLGSTNLAIGASQVAEHASNVDCVLNCDQWPISVHHQEAEAYLHLPIVNSKMDRFSLFNNLPSAVTFANSNLTKGRTLLICCRDGEDISVCVCLAILISLFDDEGSFDGGKSFGERGITKCEMRRRLVYICKFAIKARPSRGNLRQVFSFLNNGKAT
ncbi:hypothetical protein V6N12_038995 [Hibiscus sabdariffa]|uniref:Initiator tRNA phosphoribosyl transferase family protein n=1 Tax=Hibiscus sabdariffa TaxID=183260 RepID=A0ABR2DZD4_9ROSI